MVFVDIAPGLRPAVHGYLLVVWLTAAAAKSKEKLNS